MTDQAKDPELDKLEARVRVMRAIGVTKWRDIELGPVPVATGPVEDPTQRSQTREHEEEQRRHRLRFGASGGPRLTAEPPK